MNRSVLRVSKVCVGGVATALLAAAYPGDVIADCFMTGPETKYCDQAQPVAPACGIDWSSNGTCGSTMSAPEGQAGKRSSEAYHGICTYVEKFKDAASNCTVLQAQVKTWEALCYKLGSQPCTSAAIYDGEI